MADHLPRMNLNQRLQHLLLAFLVILALATGFGGPFFTIAKVMNQAAVSRLHSLAGNGIILLLAYHLLYLIVRSYVESRGWRSFPLRWEGADRRAVLGELLYLAGKQPTRPEADVFRVSQKACYWWTWIALIVIGASGLAIGYWGQLGSLGVLGHLPTFVAIHRGFSLLLLAAVLWHLYGAFVWEGRWDPVRSWWSGSLSGEQAQRRIPGAYRRFLTHQAELTAAGTVADPAELREERMRQEKHEVQSELEKGNRMALEDKYDEAIEHYRKALELYPGYSQARYNMARVLSRMGEHDKAITAYRQFLEGDPFHPLAPKAQSAIRELSRKEQP